MVFVVFQDHTGSENGKRPGLSLQPSLQRGREEGDRQEQLHRTEMGERGERAAELPLRPGTTIRGQIFITAKTAMLEEQFGYRKY